MAILVLRDPPATSAAPILTDRERTARPEKNDPRTVLRGSFHAWDGGEPGRT